MDAEAPKPADGTEKAAGFSAALRAPEAGAAAAPQAPGAADPVALAVDRFAAGEITRVEAAAEIARAAVGAWPADVGSDAARVRAAAEIAEMLAEDPAFSALLDAASGGSR